MKQKVLIGLFILSVGLGVTASLVQKSQDTRRKAAENISEGYKCYEKLIDPGPRFVVRGSDGYNGFSSLGVGMTFWLEIGVNSMGKKVSGVDVELKYDKQAIKINSILNLNSKYKSFLSETSGDKIAIFPTNGVDDVISMLNDYIVRIVFEVKKKMPQMWSIRYACTQDKLSDSNILTVTNDGGVIDILNCEDNEMFFVDREGNAGTNLEEYVWMKAPKDGYELVTDERCDKEFNPDKECWEDKQHGDYNHDGLLTLGDFTTWRNEAIDGVYLNNRIESDGDCDGLSTVMDYSRWRKEFLATTATSFEFEIPKTDKPELAFYVMSFCPYGNMMEGILRPVFDLIGNKAIIKPHYIFDKIENLTETCKSQSGDVTKCKDYIAAKYFTNETECIKYITDKYNTCSDPKNYIVSGNNYYSSLHGLVEANQNVREICAYNLATDKKLWWDFVGNVNKNCDDENADTCWEEQARSAGLDAAKITECFNKDGIKLIEEEIALKNKYKIFASPTVLVNGVEFPPDNLGPYDSITIGGIVIPSTEIRTPNAQKEALCAGFNIAPKECGTKLADIADTDSGGGCATN